MLVDIEEPDIFQPVKASIMEVGQVGVITENVCYKGDILLRTYQGFVALNRPSSTWIDRCDLKVRILSPGTKVILTLEN